MLPIRRVVLYKHGIGYFERENCVNGDASIELQFKSDEMNDVLKSLTVLDLNGGLISSISYESTKPIEKQLEDIAIRLPDRNSLSGLLSQVKGAKVEIEIGSEKNTGIITGIEEVTKSLDNTKLTSYLLTILVDGKSLKSYDVFEITSLTFLDENLQTDLAHLLEILITSKKKDAKKLTIFTKGEGERTILATYVVETPVWKVSYRVLLGKDNPMIQGWALVDNTQDEDWKNVDLTLVAGLPVSFIHDLYSPRYKKRPIIEIREEEAYAPPMLEDGIPPMGGGGEDDGFLMDEILAEPEMMKSMAFADKPLKKKMGKRDMSLRKEARKSSMPVQTRTVEVGDLFQYEIENPVTVKRNQSALVPILQTNFEGKRVAVYNESVRDKNPMSSLLIKNTTGLTLEGGPVTVMEEENYVGEAMLNTLKPDEEKLVPFSVELGCTISYDKQSNSQAYHCIRIASGYLYLDYYVIENKKYLVHNKTKKDIDLFLEHRFNHGWELVDTPKPYETTENYYRFRFDAPADKVTAFEVKEKNKLYESYYIRNISTDLLAYWSSSGYIDWKTKGKIEELLKLSGEISQLENQVEELDEEKDEIFEDQERLRENLKALGESADERKLKERYVKEFSTGEDRLKAIKKEIKELNDRKNKLEEKLNKAINNIELTKEI